MKKPRLTYSPRHRLWIGRMGTTTIVARVSYEIALRELHYYVGTRARREAQRRRNAI